MTTVTRWLFLLFKIHATSAFLTRWQRSGQIYDIGHNIKFGVRQIMPKSKRGSGKYGMSDKFLVAVK